MTDDPNKTQEEALTKLGKQLAFAQDLANIGSKMSANRAWGNVAPSALTDGKTASTYATAAANQPKEDLTFNLDSFDEMDTNKMQGIGPVKDADVNGEKRNKKKKKPKYTKSPAYSDESTA